VKLFLFRRSHLTVWTARGPSRPLLKTYWNPWSPTGSRQPDESSNGGEQRIHDRTLDSCLQAASPFRDGTTEVLRKGLEPFEIGVLCGEHCTKIRTAVRT